MTTHELDSLRSWAEDVCAVAYALDTLGTEEHERAKAVLRLLDDAVAMAPMVAAACAWLDAKQGTDAESDALVAMIDARAILDARTRGA